MQQRKLVTLEDCKALYHRGEFDKAAEGFAALWETGHEQVIFFAMIASWLAVDDEAHQRKAFNAILALMQSPPSHFLPESKLSLQDLLVKLAEKLREEKNATLATCKKYPDPNFAFWDADKAPPHVLATIGITSFWFNEDEKWLTEEVKKKYRNARFASVLSAINRKEADRFQKLKALADLNYAPARLAHADVLLHSHDDKAQKNALALLREDADKGFSAAQWRLAQLFFGEYNAIADKYIPKDIPAAKQWLEKAVQQKHPDATLALATKLIIGIDGYSQNFLKGLAYLGFAALDNEHRDAGFFYGQLIYFAHHSDTFALPELIKKILTDQAAKLWLLEHSEQQAQQMIQKAHPFPVTEIENTLAEGFGHYTNGDYEAAGKIFLIVHQNDAQHSFALLAYLASLVRKPENLSTALRYLLNFFKKPVVIPQQIMISLSIICHKLITETLSLDYLPIFEKHMKSMGLNISAEIENYKKFPLAITIEMHIGYLILQLQFKNLAEGCLQWSRLAKTNLDIWQKKSNKYKRKRAKMKANQTPAPVTQPQSQPAQLANAVELIEATKAMQAAIAKSAKLKALQTQLTEQQAALEKNFSELNQKYVAAEQTIKEKVEQVRKLKEAKQTVVADLTKAKADMATLTAELQSVREQLKTAKAAVKEHETTHKRAERLSGVTQKLYREIESLRQLLTATEKNYAQLQKESSAITVQLKNALAQVNALQAGNEQLKIQIKETKKLHDAVIQSLQVKLTAATETIRVQHQELTQHRTESQRLAELNKSQESALKQATAKSADETRQLQSAQAEIARLTKLVAEQSATITAQKASAVKPLDAKTTADPIREHYTAILNNVRDLKADPNMAWVQANDALVELQQITQDSQVKDYADLISKFSAHMKFLDIRYPELVTPAVENVQQMPVPMPQSIQPAATEMTYGVPPTNSTVVLSQQSGTLTLMPILDANGQPVIFYPPVQQPPLYPLHQNYSPSMFQSAPPTCPMPASQQPVQQFNQQISTGGQQFPLIPR